MSRDFVERRFNSDHLHTACKQQQQIAHFIKSEVQEEITEAYLTAWAHRKYITNDHFLNFVKHVFSTSNFLQFFKYLRYPLASAQLVNDQIEDPLKRVFFAEDSFFKYAIRGKQVHQPDELDSEAWNETMFNALLYRYNDIIITDLSEINTPTRFIVDIDRVVAIESKNSVISKIAYTAMYGDVKGYLYIDDFAYIFYPADEKIPPVETPHDLGRCPADYISAIPFDEKCTDVVRRSIFSYAREEFEEYVFLKTLQRMTEANGVIPVVTMLQTNVVGQNEDKRNADGEPNVADAMGSQLSAVRSEVTPSRNLLQPGDPIKVPKVMKDDGSVDMSVVDGFFHFHYMPVEPIKYMQERIKQVEQSILVNILGDFSETSESAKNELQIGKSYVSKQDRLRGIARQMDRMRKRTDFNMLALKYGPGSVELDIFYGSDFFLETQADIYAMLEISPNPIESKSLLVRLARTKNRFNDDKAKRDSILYQLLPYSTKADFDAAVLASQVGEITFQYQTRFNYWIDLFEANYGDILYFWESMEAADSAKITLINNLITDLIKANYEQPTISSDVTAGQGGSDS